MMFVAEELPRFSIKTFNFKNLCNYSNDRPWPIKNSSVAHRLGEPWFIAYSTSANSLNTETAFNFVIECLDGTVSV